jgi:hypothetical protein
MAMQQAIRLQPSGHKVTTKHTEEIKYDELDRHLIPPNYAL